jgi:hypothetical protein
MAQLPWACRDGPTGQLKLDVVVPDAGSTAGLLATSLLSLFGLRGRVAGCMNLI